MCKQIFTSKITPPYCAMLECNVGVQEGTAWVQLGGARTSRESKLLVSDTDELDSDTDKLGGETDELGSDMDKLRSETDELVSDMDKLRSETDELGSDMNKQSTSTNMQILLIAYPAYCLS